MGAQRRCNQGCPIAPLLITILIQPDHHIYTNCYFFVAPKTMSHSCDCIFFKKSERFRGLSCVNFSGVCTDYYTEYSALHCLQAAGASCSLYVQMGWALPTGVHGLARPTYERERKVHWVSFRVHGLSCVGLGFCLLFLLASQD